MNQEAQRIEDFYNRYGFLVKRICRDVLRQEEDAEDAMHETFIKFWRYSSKLKGEREAIAVLKRTALSCAIDFLRSRNRRGKYREAWRELHDMLHSESQKEVSERRMNRQIISILFRAVRVDEETLKMAYLYYLDDMTLEEVAKMTQFSRRAVGMKLERFREHALKYCRNHNISW